MKNILAFIFGSLFALGLLISGMSNPEKVLGFLDILGQWDISLMFVMMGAIIVAIIPFQKAIRNPKTIFGEEISLPMNTHIDKKLIVGSSLFGVGWGIAGICPAPAITLIGLGYSQAWYFIAAMLLGMSVHRLWSER
ncbi:YeeE/YedE family protein [Acinetobacter sp. ANC 4805]|uniref:YeeE/YedE family protein n=1 Tax=Acinetobacter sp. ANC 4805 TaxID=2923425 RepID=UPI001F4AA34B|nr:YeeE/YedE family protein [Acinetobacter sp. ANC 4805]MCH7311529.1 YeeE/YedE family protein [Acinetobacter sp. ANC 4805]